ncbi:hypothetical protein [Salinisphaera hydrothermalis]|uniref:DUF2933 domain-containing protein n=1 Tax=Salinisphaera hydrothermalis (strain C41B8) TaxID=1304275 RepID=A0A084IH29_SALHC|nr:hypothetical protein [Salinisphaera hydrothermalis]KEZ76013.1 hypothetical protein C41B8_16994 [Salinisphaera hydrothermalis C41B8]
MSCSKNQTKSSDPQAKPQHPALHWLKRQRLMIGGLAIVGLGLAFGWNGLAAAGVLPILLSTLPCLIMVGICMKSMQSCSKNEQKAEAAHAPANDSPALLPGPSPQRIEEQDHA